MCLCLPPSSLILLSIMSWNTGTELRGSYEWQESDPRWTGQERFGKLFISIILSPSFRTASSCVPFFLLRLFNPSSHHSYLPNQSSPSSVLMKIMIFGKPFCQSSHSVIPEFVAVHFAIWRTASTMPFYVTLCLRRTNHNFMFTLSPFHIIIECLSLPFFPPPPSSLSHLISMMPPVFAAHEHNK